MKVLIVGSGAREHALAWRIKQSLNLTQLWVAGGNAGTAQLADNIEIRSNDVDSLVAAAQDIAADLVVVGPEAPLTLGLVDRLDQLGIPAFGPSKAASMIEASKGFALDLMRGAGVPCPDFHVFSDQTKALDYLKSHLGPVVVKADGLAAGKGVLLCNDSEEAALAIKECMSDRAFGKAGDTVVLEEYLSGPEISVFAFCDGERISPLVAACDYKRLEEGNLGLNTGGMGSFAQPDLWNSDLSAQVESTIMRPVVRAMAEQGAPYKGVLYAGLMLTESGPTVLEFNCRLGDPETQVVIPLRKSDPLDLMMACAQGNLGQTEVIWGDRTYVGVVMVSAGYPGEYQTGFEISGLDEDGPQDTMVFHAGTKLDQPGTPLTTGGRVLTVVGGGDDLGSAKRRAYSRLETISFQGAWWRRDIGSSANHGVTQATG